MLAPDPGQLCIIMQVLRLWIGTHLPCQEVLPGSMTRRQQCLQCHIQALTPLPHGHYHTAPKKKTMQLGVIQVTLAVDQIAPGLKQTLQSGRWRAHR